MDELATAGIALAAAIVGGTIEHFWSAARARRDAVQQATLEVVRSMPVAATGTTSSVEPRDALDLNSRWSAARDHALAALTRLRVQARWLRGAEAIRDEADDLAARLGAANLRLLDGEQLTPTESVDLDSGPLLEVVFGPSFNLNEATLWYRENGFSQRAPRKVAK